MCMGIDATVVQEGQSVTIGCEAIPGDAARDWRG